MRKDIFEKGVIRCPAFTVAPMIFDSGSDDNDNCMVYDELSKQMVPVTKSKKQWKKLFDIVMDKRTDIPLKQMALKAKHESLLMNKM